MYKDIFQCGRVLSKCTKTRSKCVKTYFNVDHVGGKCTMSY